jgi:ribulose-5-phosphate 4-epimerase/fuculose-1-phosphate aldolase
MVPQDVHVGPSISIHPQIDHQHYSERIPDDRKSIDMHLAIYAAREDVHGMVHGHTPYGRAFSTKGQTISMIRQGSSPPAYPLGSL